MFHIIKCPNQIEIFLHISEIYNFVILSYILYIIRYIFLIENL